DPRSSPETDQALYDQLSHLIDAPAPGVAQVRLQGAGWYHHLSLPAEDLVALASPVLRQALTELDAALTAMSQFARPTAALRTSAAGGLPGRAKAAESRLAALLPAQHDDGDLGDLLVSPPGRTGVQILAPDALARASHTLAVRIHRGDASSSHPEG